MQNDTNIKKRNLITLYSSYYLNKISVVIFIITLILLGIVFYINANHGANETDYHIYYENIHQTYFQDSFFAVLIIVAIFSCFLGSLEGISNISKMDALILGKISRTYIIIFKSLSFLIINTLYYVIVYFLLFAMPIMFFERFPFEIRYLYILLDLILWGSFITLFSMCVSMIMQNYFAPLLSFIIFFMSQIFSDSLDNNVKQIANVVFPQISMSSELQSSFMFERLFVINYLLILLILMYLIYSKRNLKIS